MKSSVCRDEVCKVLSASTKPLPKRLGETDRPEAFHRQIGRRLEEGQVAISSTIGLALYGLGFAGGCTTGRMQRLTREWGEYQNVILEIDGTTGANVLWGGRYR